MKTLTVPKPDIDVGDGEISQEELDILYTKFLQEDRPFHMKLDGAPVYVVKLSTKAHRNIIKNDPSLRAHGCLEYLDGSDFYKIIGLDMSIAGWAHWING